MQSVFELASVLVMPVPALVNDQSRRDTPGSNSLGDFDSRYQEGGPAYTHRVEVCCAQYVDTMRKETLKSARRERMFCLHQWLRKLTIRPTCSWKAALAARRIPTSRSKHATATS